MEILTDDTDKGFASSSSCSFSPVHFHGSSYLKNLSLWHTEQHWMQIHIILYFCLALTRMQILELLTWGLICFQAAFLIPSKCTGLELLSDSACMATLNRNSGNCSPTHQVATSLGKGGRALITNQFLNQASSTRFESRRCKTPLSMFRVFLLASNKPTQSVCTQTSLKKKT